jgi:hypothetical protein
VALAIGLLIGVIVVWRQRHGQKPGPQHAISHVNPLYESGSNRAAGNESIVPENGLCVRAADKTPPDIANSTTTMLTSSIDRALDDDPNDHTYYALSPDSQTASFHTVYVEQGAGRPSSIYHVPFAVEDTRAVSVNQGSSQVVLNYHVPMAVGSEAVYATAAGVDLDTPYATPESVGSQNTEA